MTQKYTDEELSKEAFIEDTKRDYFGKEADVFLRREEPISVDLQELSYFTWGIGDDNPLYFDPAYAAKTRWGSPIAAPGIVALWRYPVGHGSQYDKPYRVHNYISGDKVEWFDVVRPGDSIRTTLIVNDAEIKRGKTGPLVFLYTEGKFWNQHGAIVAKQRGTLICTEYEAGKDRGDAVHWKAEVQKYSEEEIERIAQAYDNEYRRGADTLYWEDVKEGDKLPTVVKGPLTMMDLILHWQGGMPMTFKGVAGSFRRLYQYAKNTPLSWRRVNPVTNWPYETEVADHYDVYMTKFRGMPLPFDAGVMRIQLFYHVITNWMGDDGFLRMFDMQIRSPFFYGDTIWFTGEVVKKHKVVEGGIEYGAVDIKVNGPNQRGESTAPGIATVYLPSPGRPVQVPIPVSE